MDRVLLVFCLLFVCEICLGSFVPFVIDNHIKDYSSFSETQGSLDQVSEINLLYNVSLFISDQYQAKLREIPEFITSTSIDMNYLAQEEQLLDLHTTNCRVYCMWSYVEPSLSEIESFTVQELRQNTSWIEPYSATLSWEETDYQIQELSARGVSPIIEIGEGTDHALPKVSNSTSGVADPKTIGEQQYLAYMYRYGRAVVHRYKSNVTIWQVENELNDAYLEAFVGIRSPRSLIPMNTPWGNFTFLTELIQTLYMAVKDEDASLWVTHNLLCDTPHDVYELSGIPMYYLDALHAWEPLLDMVSFDAYPNAMLAYPIYDSFLVNATNEIRNTLVDKNRPIMIAETGSLVMSNSSLEDVTLKPVNFTANSQAEYLSATFEATMVAGIKGFQVFKLAPNEGFDEPPGGYTNQDVHFLQAITDSIVDNTIRPLVDWLASLRDIRYILEGRAYEVLTAPSTVNYGILNAGGYPLSSYRALQQLYALNTDFSRTHENTM